MTQDEELIEREATARAIEGLKWAPCQTIDDAIAFIASAIRNDRVFPAADRLEALARPVVGVEGLSMLSAMLDADMAREGPMASFMIRAGLLREILDSLAALAASPSPVVGDRDAIADSLKHCKALILSTGREIPVADGKITLPGDLTDTERTELRGILSLSTPVVGGIKDALGQTLTLIDDLYREYGIALNDEHVAVARHARGVWLDAPDPYTTDRAGMAQEVE